MKAPLFLVPAVALVCAFPSTKSSAVDLRANDQVPPVPPGKSLPPPLPPAATPTPPSTASSQSPTPSSPGRAGGRLEKLKQALGLTPTQVAKIQPILEKAGQQIKTLRASVALSTAQKRQQIRQIVVSSFQQIRPILTPQQLQKWKQFREDHHTNSTAST